MGLPAESLTNLNTRYITIVLELNALDYPDLPQSSASSFPSTGSAIKIITANSEPNNLAVEMSINKASGINVCTADVVIKGMQYEDVIAASTFGIRYEQAWSSNTITIYAGYSLGENGYPPLVYGPGVILMATPDFNQPDRPFMITSSMGFNYINGATTTYSAKGALPLDTLFRQLVNIIDSNLVYQSLGVSGNAYNPVYVGSPWQNLKTACAHYGYQMQLDNTTIKIAKYNAAYSSNVVSLNASNGMLGYPILIQYGCMVRCRFNPNIQFGESVQLDSYFTTCNNNAIAGYPSWFINGMIHNLGNKTPKFETTLYLNSWEYVANE